MPIDIRTDHVISLTEAAAHVPRRRRGRKAAVSTIYRWANVGVRGKRLETLQVGGTRCTSLEALQRFFESITSRNADQLLADSIPRQIGKRQASAEQQLDDFWARKKHQESTVGA